MNNQNNNGGKDMQNYNNISQKSGEENIMTTKEWVLNLFLISIPIVGIIMLLVWAFGDDNGNKTRKNFSRGYLLFSLIVTAVVIVIYVIMVVFILAAVNSFN